MNRHDASDDAHGAGGPGGDDPPVIRPVVPDFFAFSPEAARAVDTVQHEMSREREWEAFRALVELRRRLSGFTKRLVALVYVPQCEDCYAAERHQMQADEGTWRPPDIASTTWRRDLREHGASHGDIRRTYRKMCSTTRDLPPVRCDTCRGEIVYGRDNVYVHARPLEAHIPELEGGDRPPRRQASQRERELVYRAYEGHCAGCGCALTRGEATLDHIVPQHSEGYATLANLQLACERCNNAEKGGTEPEEVHVFLDLLLVAPDSSLTAIARLADF